MSTHVWLRSLFRSWYVCMCAINCDGCLRVIRELKKWRRRDDDDASHPRNTGPRVWFSEGKFEFVHAPFDLDELNEAECVAEFRFRKRDVRALAGVLRVPDTITCEQGSVCTGIEGLCMLLRRMSYPCRYGDILPRFAKPVPVLSVITNQMLDFIYNVHGHKVLNWNHDLLSPANLQTYVDTITAKGAPLDNCFGFIDGTIRAIARPEEHQRILYNGHKRVHALKFQSIALPNGLIGNLYGPVGK